MQYSSTHRTITKVKQLLKWRNINHTYPPLTNSKRNAKMSRNVLVTKRSVRLIILSYNNGKYGTFSELSVGSIILYAITQRLFKISGVYDSTNSYTFSYHMYHIQKNVTEHKFYVICSSIYSSIKLHILSIIEWYIVINSHVSPWKVSTSFFRF